MKYLFPALIVFLSLAITSCDRTTPLIAGACYPYCSIESRPELTLKTEQYLRSNKTKAFINTASLLAGNLYYVRPTDEDQALRWWMKIAEIADDSDEVNYELIKHYKKKKKYKKVQELALKYVKSKPLKFSEGNYAHYYYYILKLLITSYMEDRRGSPRDYDEALKWYKVGLAGNLPEGTSHYISSHRKEFSEFFGPYEQAQLIKTVNLKKNVVNLVSRTTHQRCQTACLIFIKLVS